MQRSFCGLFTMPLPPVPYCAGCGGYQETGCECQERKGMTTYKLSRDKTRLIITTTKEIQRRQVIITIDGDEVRVTATAGVPHVPVTWTVDPVIQTRLDFARNWAQDIWLDGEVNWTREDNTCTSSTVLTDNGGARFLPDELDAIRSLRPD